MVCDGVTPRHAVPNDRSGAEPRQRDPNLRGRAVGDRGSLRAWHRCDPDYVLFVCPAVSTAVKKAAAVVAEHLVSAGVWDFRMGIADGIFAAEHAARRAAPQDCWIIPPGGSAVFLAVLPIGVLENAELVTLLRRLGIRSLGDFASLASRDVLTRFGREGALLHRLARGLDKQPVVSRRPPLDVNQRVSFTPALETVEPIVFSARQTAEKLVAELAYHGLVCTQVRIEVVTEGGWTGSRVWAHSRWFAASDLIDRIYWQLQGDPAPEPVWRVTAAS